MAEQSLFKTIEGAKEGVKRFAPEIFKIPDYILDNIKYTPYQWQKEALENFLYYQNPQSDLKTLPTHLMFNMATGTGKTLVMAALILYYYKQGYRHFLFFVNQNNIVDKTESNFLDPFHNKYLYANPIVIDNQTVNFKQVDSFTDVDEDDGEIQIIFTSIHKLHNAIYTVKENQVFLEDLQKRNIVMLGDEAHHLNSDTKKKKGEQTDLDLKTEMSAFSSQKDKEKSWERTVTELILEKKEADQSHENRNVLLEFTATVPKNKNVQAKYKNKTVYKFDIESFLRAGYTKEINLVSSSEDRKQRILQALLFNWYRSEIAIKHGIPNFKPVILFRSKFVKKKKEENIYKDYALFRETVDSLKPDDFGFLKTVKKESVKKVYKKGKSRLVDIDKYITDNDISLTQIINYIKGNFKDNQNCILTHSQKKEATGRWGEDKTTPEQDELLNNLEDKNNPITAIFTCKRLTEGWDVLNLFDIVRMYEGETRGGGHRDQPGKSTVSEVQLIGRGVRYYPFQYNNEIPNKRKFDNDLQNDLRVLEELYYHCDDNKNYVFELKAELKRKKLLPEDDKQLKVFDVKKQIKEDENSFYNSTKIYQNNRVENPNRKKRSLENIKASWEFKDRIENVSILEEGIEFEKETDKTRFKIVSEDGRIIKVKVSEIYQNFRHILFKALNVQSQKNRSILRFNLLKKDLALDSREELFSDNFIGDFVITIAVPEEIKHFSEIQAKDKLNILTNFLKQFAKELQEYSNPYIGTNFVAEDFSTYFAAPKEKSISPDEESKRLEQDLIGKNWYALNSFHGTSEEKSLIKFLKDSMENFKSIYGQVSLLRNEEVYKIYDFDKGRGFQPDFLLFLKKKNQNLYYQVFIEPKGDQFKDASGGFDESGESWKQDFLEQITKKYGGEFILKSENKDYKLIGLPLYNDKSKNPFKEKAKEVLGVDI